MNPLSSEELGELKGIFKHLISIDTSNPPGNETPAARYIAELLSKDSIGSDLIESQLGRGNIVARIGKGGGRSLLFLGHLDVVPPGSRENWTRPPFGAIEQEGRIYGRGAADMKNMVAAQVFAFLKIARENRRIDGTLILAETADEENGGAKGIGYLVQNVPQLVKADYSVTEGGGLVVSGKGGRYIGYETGEKGIYWTKLLFQGTGGHASVPYILDNPVVKAATAIQRITHAMELRHSNEAALDHLRAAAKAYAIGNLNEDGSNYEELMERLRIVDEFSWSRIRAQAAVTATPTMMSSGIRPNVAPPSAEITIDCRVLPGVDKEEIKQWLLENAGTSCRVEEIAFSPSSTSTIDPTFEFALTEALKAHAGADGTFRYMLPAGTDSRYVRALGAQAVGVEVYSPSVDMRDIDQRTHAPDEYIDIDSLKRMAEFYLDLIERLLGQV